MVATSQWLKKQGISRQLADSYKRHAWIVSLGHGAYARAGDDVRWLGALHAIQQNPDCGIHIAAKTALEILGYGHFISANSNAPVWLMGHPGERLPRWFENAPWGNALHYASAALFRAPKRKSIGLTKREVGGMEVRLSSPERAILEVLYFVPQQQSFEETTLLMEGLASLRPKLMQELLEACASVKVKRLFLVLADHFRHPWRSSLELSRVDLGTGKRQITRGGRLHPKYQITLPTDFYPPTET